MQNWEEMTPEERDKLIAEKVMGYETGEMPSGTMMMWGDSGLMAEIPRYTRSMDAAWQVLQHMIEHHWTSYPSSNKVWDRFCEANYQGYASLGDIYRWVASWTPERLCKAALIAYGIEVE